MTLSVSKQVSLPFTCQVIEQTTIKWSDYLPGPFGIINIVVRLKLARFTFFGTLLCLESQRV